MGVNDVSPAEFMTVVQVYDCVVIGPVNGYLYALVKGGGEDDRYRTAVG